MSLLDGQEGIAEHTATSTASPTRRVLACILCQQRKVKCDRKFPCANCTRTRAQCVPASLLPRQRRRRYPERELLERLRHYERLLRQNNITFESLHQENKSQSEGGSTSDVHLERSRDEIAVKSKGVVDLWHAISRVTLDSENEESEDDGEGVVQGEADGNGGGYGDGDGIGNGNQNINSAPVNDNHPARHRDAAAKKSWTRKFQTDEREGSEGIGGNDHLLFGPSRTNVCLSASHPEQVQIFRLWQIYLDNVNPLLKVTHTPTLQPRILDAASNVGNISSPALEALIFSVYCISVTSLSEDECHTLFRSPKKDLLAGHHSACQQALLKCNIWRSGNVDALTALYLYLLSIRPQTDPRSLSCMLAIAIRIAQRMGMHNESTYTGCTALEAEMRRRLWWSLVIFDHRICEMSDYKTTTLVPTWDCSTPSNVNDFEIRPEMKSLPAIHEKPTEAVFAVVRSELADFVCHSAFHLSFVNPSLDTIAQSKDALYSGPISEGDGLMSVENIIETKYLAFCNAEDPLHYMTIWTTRGSLARNRLLEHYSKYFTSPVQPTDAQRSAALSYALSMLECDTKLRTSPLTKGYIWLVEFHFPALAYLHILNGLRKRPAEHQADAAWTAISDNYDALTTHSKQHGGEEQEAGPLRIFVAFSRAILQAWEAREALLRQQHKLPELPPRIVSDVKDERTQISSNFFSDHSNGEQPNEVVIGINSTHSSLMPTGPTDLGGYQGTGEVGQSFKFPGPEDYYPDIPGQVIMDVDVDQFWSEIDWRWMHTERG